MSRRARGFTLIEVLVALAIVAFGMTAVLASMTSAADNAFFMRNKTLASWVAQNQLSTVRLVNQIPKKGKSDGEVKDFAGRNWVWQQEVQPMQAKGLWRIDVSARPLDEGESKSAALSKKASWYVTESAVIGDAVDLGVGDMSSWFPSGTGGDPNETGQGDGH